MSEKSEFSQKLFDKESLFIFNSYLTELNLNFEEFNVSPNDRTYLADKLTIFLRFCLQELDLKTFKSEILKKILQEIGSPEEFLASEKKIGKCLQCKRYFSLKDSTSICENCKQAKQSSFTILIEKISILRKWFDNSIFPLNFFYFVVFWISIASFTIFPPISLFYLYYGLKWKKFSNFNEVQSRVISQVSLFSILLVIGITLPIIRLLYIFYSNEFDLNYSILFLFVILTYFYVINKNAKIYFNSKSYLELLAVITDEKNLVKQSYNRRLSKNILIITGLYFSACVIIILLGESSGSEIYYTYFLNIITIIFSFLTFYFGFKNIKKLNLKTTTIGFFFNNIKVMSLSN